MLTLIIADLQECGYINVFEIVEVFGSVAAEEAAAVAAAAAQGAQPSADQTSDGEPIIIRAHNPIEART
jgi:hypothetical protein